MTYHKLNDSFIHEFGIFFAHWFPLGTTCVGNAEANTLEIIREAKVHVKIFCAVSFSSIFKMEEDIMLQKLLLLTILLIL